MKTIGLIGGMSWESTQTYYQLINQKVRDELGGLHSARLVLYSVDFAEIETLQHQGDWAATGEILGAAGKALRDRQGACQQRAGIVREIEQETEIAVGQGRDAGQVHPRQAAIGRGRALGCVCH